jgi:predicted dehydrogenase
MTPLCVGVVGCGNISGIYFKNLGRYRSTEIVACADLDLDRARCAAETNGVAIGCSTEDLLANPDVDLVLNLTVPNAHASVALAAVEAGKHVYNEKPLTISREDGKRLVDLAKAKGVRVGCAPDTFMGGGIQTCRKLIDEGAIGEPIAPSHPSPEFYYEKGGGPMFDMGPYYLTALVNLMGPITGVSGSARATFPTRTITSQPKNGKVIGVETPTHIAGIMEFASGAIGEITTSFDVWYSKLPPITIHGTEGSMLVGDPNGFGENVYYRRKGDSDWRWQPLTHGFAENSRGVGVLDIAHAIQGNRAHRASGDLAYHVLDAMHAFLDSSDQGRKISLESGVQRPAAMAENEFAEDLAERVPAGV